MHTDAPCSACSWTAEREKACHYHSNVNLFYSCSDRGVWSVGSRLIIKDRGEYPPSAEAKNLKFLKDSTSIPVPDVIYEWIENGRHFLVSTLIPGENLNDAWPKLSPVERIGIAKQTVEYLAQLRQLQSPQIQSLEGGPVYCGFLFPGGDAVPHGPISNDEELWLEIDKGLGSVPEKARLKLKSLMPPSGPYTFTHGDLTDKNIIVKDGKLAGIIDWERSGYLPVWWEFVCNRIIDSDVDGEWKELLRSEMTQYPDAGNFWVNLHSLRWYPKLDERATKFLEDLNISP